MTHIKIRPILETESEEVYRMFQEIPQEENEATNKAHGLSFDGFQDFCKKAVLRSKESPQDGHAITITYLIFDGEIPVGFGKFRPIMTELCVQNRAFHFAYMIAPKFRGRGYATAFIKFLKNEALKYGLTEIRGTALIDNKASCKVMEKNGGIMEDCSDGEATYVISLID
ncbi:MAG: GNAT family N-acetyltransferase [Alphaproteobacteria bacterium]|nr:GNAT family N-acetyltransferase [Alphaproteobacteria bacterium]